MNFNETYLLNLKVNESVVEINESDISFDIHSSINSFYNNAILKIKDSTGYLRENLLFTEGILYELSFGFKDNFLTCEYVFESDDTKEQERNDTVSLPIEFNK